MRLYTEKIMIETDYMAGRIKELADRAYKNDYITHTAFLGASEQASFHSALRKLGVPKLVTEVAGVPYLLWGGHSEAERVMAFFLPSYLTPETFMEQENEAPSVLTCMKAEPLMRKFSDDLTHRDFLGALMNLGIERETIGDILIDREDASAYIFVTADLAPIIKEELVRVKHTSVACREIALSECTARPEFEVREGSVASERLDAVLAFVFRLARGKAQELITREAVFVDGRTAVSAGADLAPGSRVSVRGFGKFIYDGTSAATKKGRNFIKVRIFK